jgi:hypothetical protein
MHRKLMQSMILAICLMMAAGAANNQNALGAKSSDNVAPIGKEGNIANSTEGFIIIDNYMIYSPKTNQPDNPAIPKTILDNPINDSCDDAIPIGEVQNRLFNTAGATFDGPGACLNMPNIWFLYTSTITGLVDIRTCSVDTFPVVLDTKLAVYDGATCFPFENIPTPGILAGGETIGSATPITDPLPVSVRGTTAGHNHDYTLSCTFESVAPDIVYSYTATENDSVTFSLLGSDVSFNTALGIFNGEGVELACNNDEDVSEGRSRILNFPVTAGQTYYIVVTGGWLTDNGIYVLTLSSPDYTLLGCNGDYCLAKSQLTIDVIQGHQYLIEIGGQSGRGDTVGYGYLTVAPVSTTPPNDNCASATQGGVLDPGATIQFTGNCTGATIDCPSINPFPEVWITFTTEYTMNIRLDHCGITTNRGFEYIYLNNTCPCNGIVFRASPSSCYCPDSNLVTGIFWSGLPAGTYWYPVSYMVGVSDGPYVINLTSLSTVSIDEQPDLPIDFDLSQNYPNPFNSTTAIQFSLKTTGDVKLSIYNILGERVKTFDMGTQSAGLHNVLWNGTDQAGKMVPSGIYFYRLENREGSLVKRMMLLK